MSRKSIEAWIHETIIDTDHDGKCTRIVLSQMVGMGRTEVHTLKLTDTAVYEPKNLAAMFTGKADVVCQDTPGESRFVLDAYWRDSNEPQSFFPFVRRGQTEGRHGLVHPPTEEGQKMQTMEWSQSLLGQVYKRQDRMDERQAQAEDRHIRREEILYGRLEHVMEENFKFFTFIKEIMAMQSLDQHKQAMEKAAYQRQSKREEKLMDAAPILLNIVAGREVVPQSVVDTKIVEALARKVTPEMLGMLSMLGLSEEEQGILAHRINQVKEKEEKEDEHRRQLPQTSLSPDEELTPPGKDGQH